MKLGRRAVKTDSRTLKIGRYLTTALPAPPPSIDWTGGRGAGWGMMLNGPDPSNPPECPDGLGDCTIAGCGHAIQIWTMNIGSMFTMPDAVIEGAYEAWDGYNPDDPSTDQGGIELDVLNDWKKNLHGYFRQHPLLAHADATPANHTEIQQVISLFGGCYIGMNVPNFITAGANPPALWDVVADDGGIDGGHCVFCVGYDQQGVSFISWGSVYKMTWAYWDKYVDEAHALLGKNWLNTVGIDPAGVNLAQLQQDLAAIV